MTGEERGEMERGERREKRGKRDDRREARRQEKGKRREKQRRQECVAMFCLAMQRGLIGLVTEPQRVRDARLLRDAARCRRGRCRLGAESRQHLDGDPAVAVRRLVHGRVPVGVGEPGGAAAGGAGREGGEDQPQ